MKHLFQFLIASILLLLVTICTAHAQATCPPDRFACIDEAPFTVTGGNPAGGTYSGPGVSAGVFSPSAAGTGAKTITYSTAGGANNCTFTINVRPKPMINLPLGFFATCINDTPGPIEQFVLLGPSTTSDGDSYTITSWTGPDGLLGPGNTFNPATAGIGFYQFTAIATTIHGCTTDPMTFPVGVTGESAVSCSGTQTVSVATAPFTLTGGTNLTQHWRSIPNSGPYSGTGVSYSSGIYTYNPAAAGIGTHEITYTIDNSCGEPASCKFNMVVTAAPPTCPADRSVCANEADFALTGASPAGGTYSGPGVSGGIFSPGLAGTGAKTITYTYQDGGNTTTCTFIITVNPAPIIPLVLGVFPYCIEGGPLEITQFFGTAGPAYTDPPQTITTSWAGLGITGTPETGYMFDRAAVGPGFYQYPVTATTPFGCSTTAMSTLAIDGPSAAACPNDITISVFASPFTLTGAKNLTVYGMRSPSVPATDIGGIYSGTAVNSVTKVFDPSVAGEGVHQITYTVDTQCGPAATCTFNIKTTPMPVKLVSFAAKRNENKILLNWKTAEETGFDRFEIEKSENPKRGFAKIGQVAGKGVSHTYSFLDNGAIAPGVPVYYRLKMVDLDGTYAYSKIVWEAVDGAKVMTVYPNPVSGELSVLSQSDLIDIQLMNVKGTTVLKQKPEQSKVNMLDVSRLPVGTYIIRTKDIHGQIYKSKVVVQR